MKKFFALLLLLLFLAPAALGEAQFSFPTGEQFSIAAEWVGQQYRGADYAREKIFRLDIIREETKEIFQSLYVSTQDDFEGRPGIVAKDLDFDGYPDLDILYLLGASNSQHTFFFYNPNESAFEARNIGAIWLSNYTLYPEKQLVYNYIHDSAATGASEIYRWEDGRLRLVRRAEICFDEKSPMTLILSVREPDEDWGGTRETYRRSLDLNQAAAGAELALHQEMEKLLWQGL